MEIKIKTLTPLWTGGVEPGKVDRIHETGILGSLRWWYEVMVRGLGGYACDPSQGRCAFDAKKYQESKAADERHRLRDDGLCDVCQIFGATGWRRRFRLTIVDSTAPDPSVQQKIQVKKDTRESRWYFPKDQNDKPRSGALILCIQAVDPEFSPMIIAGLIQFIADWTALGARAQMGFGVITIANGQLATQPLYKYVVSTAGTRKYSDLPSLQNIFLARIAPKNGSKFSDQDTFNLKYDLRRLFASNQPLRHFIMGVVNGQRLAAKVKMSRPYNDGQEMRLWGWIPEKADVYADSWNRDTVADKIHKHLEKHYNVQVWREMNSNRDTVTPDNNDARAFFKSLLGV